MAGLTAAPIQLAAIEKGRAHFAVEACNLQRLLKQFSINVGKLGDLLVQVFLAFVFGGVQNLEEKRKLGSEVGPVLGGACFEPIAKRLLVEYPRVVGEEAEHQADQQYFEIVPSVAGRLELSWSLPICSAALM